jgi:predicted RNA-binding Zn-ribbon protein involved in translation (DUF1610 family)
MTQVDEQLARKLSDRYWSTDESVSLIAEEVGISKGRLYEIIRPLAVEGICPRCGSGPPVYPNRTARDRHEVECPVCGWQGEDGEILPGTPVPPQDRRAYVRSQDQPSGVARATEAVSQPVSGMVGGILVGLAAGLMIGRLTKS